MAEQLSNVDSTSQFCLWQLLTAELNHGVDAIEDVALEALDTLRAQDRTQRYGNIVAILA